MKTMVLAEKPSVGKDIARVLGCKAGGGGFIESPKYVVTWALGHLVQLAEPEDYDQRYKTWDIGHLPIMPEKLQLTVIPQTAKQYKTVKDILHRSDVSDIIIATDAGREGELVARWIIEKAGCRKPIKRLWISSVTDKAISEGFQSLKDGKFYLNLCDSAKARAEADWLVGINATRCLTTKFNSQLSCGRVQTPTLAIIAKREEEIRRFVAKPFYGLTADAGSFTLRWADSKTGSPQCFDKGRIDGLLAALRGEREGVVISVDKTAKKKLPPRLYDLTELQRDASKLYGYSPKETLSVMQRLYEEYKVLTYPRTDSRYISSDIVPTLPDRLRACPRQYGKIVGQILRQPIRPNANYVDNAKVSDHHAIIPTEQGIEMSILGERERKVYDLVVKRFLTVFLPAFEYEQTKLRVKIGHEVFTASGKAVLAQGYKEAFNIDDEDDENTDEGGSQTLPRFKNSDSIPVRGMKLTEGRTSPPPPFNEATLLSAMENPTKYMENHDKAIAEALEQTGGLGTVATRADIIEKLFDNFAIEKKGKDIFTTAKGRQLLQLVPKDLKSPELTGAWERQLQSISQGKLDKAAFLTGIRKYTTDIIREIKASTQIFKHDNLTTEKCPECGKFMLRVSGKKGEMLVCQDRDCNARINISFSIRSRCPNCHKFLSITGEGDKKTVVCACGYKERYDAFERRKKAEPSKRELQNFMENQNKRKNDADRSDNPFAALTGMKFE
ncbi:MAG: DNA topoisomerase III [Clostridiales bacterium]|jgi:DNA topoisomerase-3|nr:DNA topoisomerase III [Clostridiales bacterium]